MRNLMFLFACLAVLLGTFTSKSPSASQKPLSVDPIVVFESTPDHLTLDVSLPDVILDDAVMPDRNTYNVLSVPDAAFLAEGKPNLPLFGADILVPNGTTNVHVEAVPGEAETWVLPHPLIPLQPPLADLEDSPVPAFTIDEAAYASSSEYPGYFAQAGPIEVMRGQQMAFVQIFPYQYIATSRELKIYPNLRVTFVFEGDLEPIELRLKDPLFDEMYRRIAINANEILQAEEEASYPPDAKFGPYGWDYLIFTDPAFEAAANKLAAWKLKSGYKPLVTKVPAAWKPDDIKNALLDAYYNWDIPPKYVLLIGDAEHIAPFYRTWHIYNGTPYKGVLDNQGYNATDIYYSTLESAGSIPDQDLKPEVLLGRLSVETAYQAMDRVEAIINYEKSPPSDSSFYNNLVAAAQFQDGGELTIYVKNTGQTFTSSLPVNGIEDRRFTQSIEDVAQFFAAAPLSKNVRRLYYADFDTNNPSEWPKKWNDNKQQIQSWVNFNGVNTTVGAAIPASLNYPTYPWNANAASITSAINEGAFLAIHRDHGARDHWGKPRLDYLDVFLLNNVDKLPVVWSLNCETGWFDNETDFKGKSGLVDQTTNSQEGFSEAWERPFGSAISDQDYGAVGVLAATRVTYGSYNNRLLMGLTDAIWPTYLKPASTAKPIYQMGAVMNHAKAYMSATSAHGVTETLQLEGYHWFGDPTTSIRTVKPPLMAVFNTTPWPWLLHQTDLGIHVDWLTESETIGGPVDKAKVTITPKNDSSSDQWSVLTDVEGEALFEGLILPEPGQYDVVVTADNHIPISTTIDVEPGSAGGIGLDAEVYPCHAEVAVHVADIDLEGAGTLDGVEVSTSGGDNETIALAEISPGYFLGGLAATPLEGAEPIPGNGELEVSDGDIISAAYFDANDGGDGSGWIVDQAQVDCSAPVFDGVGEASFLGCYARLSWSPADDPHGLIQYGIYRSPVEGALGELVASTWTPSWTDFVCGLGPRQYYSVRARDAIGNQDGNEVQVEFTFYDIFLPLVAK